MCQDMCTYYEDLVYRVWTVDTWRPGDADKLVVIGDGLSPVRRQANYLITRTVPTDRPLDILVHTSAKFNQSTLNFTQEYALESFVCKMAALVYRPQCVEIITVTSHGRHGHLLKITGNSSAYYTAYFG